MAIRLLVSVRNAEEAAAAVDGGADIVDVKEPKRGSLGYAGAPAISGVLDVIRGRCPVSAALGECLDIDDNTLETMRLPSGLSFVKMGLSRLQSATAVSSASVTNAAAGEVTDWHRQWSAARGRICSLNSWDDNSADPSWVSVAYADFPEAGAPEPEEILDAAIAHSTGLLIDTWGKSGTSSLDCLTHGRLARLRETASDNGLLFALAGKMTESHIPAIRTLKPDVLAVRGAVCLRGDRCAAISAAKVKSLKSALR